MSEYVYAGLTSQTIDIFLRDSSSTTGQGLAGLVFNSASLVASYRKGATGSRTAITLATQTVGGAYSSGGFVEIDATNMKGVYRLDIPNAAVDTEGFVTLYLYGATNLLPTALRIDCRPLPVDVKKFGGTAGTFASGLPTVELDSATATQIDNIEATLTTLGSESTTVERSVSDTNAITFSWPVSGATITGTLSLNNGAYGAVAGAIAFLRTETGRHYYTLGYNAADRPSAEGQVRYKFVDGTYTGYVVLRTVTTVLADAAHGGAAATLVLSTIDIQPASADTPGVLIRGTGSAAGVDVKGGEYADGIKARSGDTSGYGICSNGVQGGARFWSTNGYGVRVSSDNSNAFSIYGGTYAFQINSVNNAIDVYSSTGNAVYLQSAQNDAVVIYPGADDIGVHIWGGQTSGDAVALSSNGTGSVFYPVDLSGLNDLSAADVNAEVVDVLSVDTFAELSAPPAATSSLKDKLTWLFMYARNKVTQTATTRTLYRDDTTTVAGTSGTSDNGTTFTKGEDA